MDPRVRGKDLRDQLQQREDVLVPIPPAEEDEKHSQQRDGKRPLAAFRQSEPVESRDELLELLASVPEEPERPPFWCGYRVVPERFEFWIAREDDVHDRFEYRRSGDGWHRRRLQP